MTEHFGTLKQQSNQSLVLTAQTVKEPVLHSIKKKIRFSYFKVHKFLIKCKVSTQYFKMLVIKIKSFEMF